MAKTFSRLATVAGLTVAFATGCTPLDNAIASVPYLAMMRSSPFFDPYEAPLPSPPGSIPFEGPQGVHLPPLEGTDAAISAFAASPAGQNPYTTSDTTVLAYGQKMFERHCSVCHGKDGTGNGSVVGPDRFPSNPPNIVTSGKSPGYVYGIIRAGRTMMPSYGARTSHTDRWAIATYVQHLQQQGGAAAPTVTPATTPSQAPSPAPAGQENQ